MKDTHRAVYIIDGARTPFLKASGKPNPLSASDLAVRAAQELIARQPFPPSAIEEVVAGAVAPAPDESNIGRIIALRLGLGDDVPGFTVQRNCASGLQAIDSASKDIANGRYNLVLAGGTECMSRLPFLYPEAMVSWLADLRSAKGFYNQLKALLGFRPYFMKPIVSLLKGLVDPIVNLSMGQTAEILAYDFKISREEMDNFALESHQRALTAKEYGFFKEIVTLFDWQGGVLEFDAGVRLDTSLQKLATLKPVFDKPFGNVTAGNSSPVSDGAAFLILASGDAVKKYHLPVMGKIVASTFAALDPALMGLGPVHAIAHLLKTENLTLEDIDYWEVNEAFAAQVLACLKAMEDETYCQQKLGLKTALGKIPRDKLNVDGGAIAIGHPVGASGARLVLHLLHILERNKAKRGIASLCIGGGQGGAMLLERAEGEI